MSAVAEQRRTRDGGLVVTVDDLRIGDRLRFAGRGQALWFPISQIDEKPRSRRIWVKAGHFSIQMEVGLMRRTTCVARGLRKDER